MRPWRRQLILSCLLLISFLLFCIITQKSRPIPIQKTNVAPNKMQPHLFASHKYFSELSQQNSKKKLSIKSLTYFTECFFKNITNHRNRKSLRDMGAFIRVNILPYFMYELWYDCTTTILLQIIAYSYQIFQYIFYRSSIEKFQT